MWSRTRRVWRTVRSDAHQRYKQVAGLEERCIRRTAALLATITSNGLSLSSAMCDNRRTEDTNGHAKLECLPLPLTARAR